MSGEEKKVVSLAQPKILRAFRPGDLVFIETTRVMTTVEMQAIDKRFRELVPEVKIIVLQAGLRIAAREEDPADEEG